VIRWPPSSPLEPIWSFATARVKARHWDSNPALINRAFEILDPEEAEAVLADAVSYAESVGWFFDPADHFRDTYFRGSKDLGAGPALITISLIDAEQSDLGGPVNLWVQMHYGSDRDPD
jgi:hypothetical protein